MKVNWYNPELKELDKKLKENVKKFKKLQKRQNELEKEIKLIVDDSLAQQFHVDVITKETGIRVVLGVKTGKLLTRGMIDGVEKDIDMIFEGIKQLEEEEIELHFKFKEEE